MEEIMARPDRTRHLFLVSAALLALGAWPPSAAFAKSPSTKQCKPQQHSGPVSPLLPKQSAKTAAIKLWQNDVQAVYGEPWMLWSNAAANSIQCSPASANPHAKAACKAIARPCRWKQEATETHPPYPSLSISIGFGGIDLGRPRRSRGPAFVGGSTSRGRAR
jgi:hypothetical protein